MVAIALYQPDIPQNTGAIMRMAACLGVPLHVIGPTGFDMSDRALRRAGMDYLDHVDLTRHTSWQAFRAAHAEQNPRLVLMTTKAEHNYTGFDFDRNDCLMFGRESAGVPDDVHDAADVRLTIPMINNLRSLNVAMAAAMVTGEALRQTREHDFGRT